jgi:hypothetical protein
MAHDRIALACSVVQPGRQAQGMPYRAHAYRSDQWKPCSRDSALWSGPPSPRTRQNPSSIGIVPRALRRLVIEPRELRNDYQERHDVLLKALCGRNTGRPVSRVSSARSLAGSATAARRWQTQPRVRTPPTGDAAEPESCREWGDGRMRRGRRSSVRQVRFACGGQLMEWINGEACPANGVAMGDATASHHHAAAGTSSPCLIADRSQSSFERPPCSSHCGANPTAILRAEGNSWHRVVHLRSGPLAQTRLQELHRGPYLAGEGQTPTG